MDVARKKELKDTYKSRTKIGGICCIKCDGNQRLYLQATNDTASLRNRYRFAISTGSCPDPSLRKDWTKYGEKSFSFTVLEEIKKEESQSEKEFLDDINVLYEIWLEKIDNSALAGGNQNEATDKNRTIF